MVHFSKLLTGVLLVNTVYAANSLVSINETSSDETIMKHPVVTGPLSLSPQLPYGQHIPLALSQRVGSEEQVFNPDVQHAKRITNLHTLLGTDMQSG